MRAYIVDLVFGAFAFGDDGGLIDYELSPRSMDEAVEEALKIERGEVYEPLMRLAGRLRERGVKSLIVEDVEMARRLAKAGWEVSVEFGNRVAFNARSRVIELALETEFAASEEEANSWLYSVYVEYTRRKLRSYAEKRDLLAAHAIRAIDDIDKTTNLFSARLREWYSVHFPELNEIVRDHEEYSRIVAELGHRDAVTEEALAKLGIGGARASKIAEAARNSIGADLSVHDVEAIRTLARINRDLFELRRRLTDYIDQVMKEVAPNITAIVGPTLGARLISLAGSLERLAKLPASTIQVLGAEKALFRALRTGGKPPKHGVIFQYPAIHRSPRWQRGKIARALASKLAIAAKVDAFSGRFIGDKLSEELQSRITEVKTMYARPPPRRPEQRPPRRRKRRR